MTTPATGGVAVVLDIGIDDVTMDQAVEMIGEMVRNGREHGVFGFEEYLEVKAVLGYQTA